MANKIVKKLSIKSVFGDKKAILNAATADGKNIVRFFGLANGTETGESDNGPWVAFKGRFQGLNLITGETVISGKLFMPDVAGDLLEAALSDASAVEFGFDIGVVADDSAATGYVYTATPLVETTEDDPLKRLAAQLPAFSLPAPKAEAGEVVEAVAEEAPKKK